jgi:hypothetical protein
MSIMSLRRATRAFVLLPSFLVLLSGCSGSVTTELSTRKVGGGRGEDSLESPRQILTGSPDRGSCSTALQQLNGYLATHPDKRPPALTNDQKSLLMRRFGLDAGEITEVESPTFTLLDAPHLEFCFLLRDVARSLDVETLSPAEQAATAFAWTMRQVIPQAGEGAMAPDFVLRRGSGTGLERAYIFLSLLQQMGIPGCLLTTPSNSVPWGCGALVEVEGVKEKQVLVFDHRLGLPLPGTTGKSASPLVRAFRLALPVKGSEDNRQIATLADLRKQPELLKPLTIDEKYPYDVGAEQLKETVVRLAPPLSALSPRMRALQDHLQPEAAGLRPAVDAAGLIEQFGSAAGVEDGADAVRAREGSAGVMRRFLGEGEGGIDKDGRSQIARLALLPPNTLPPEISGLEGDPGTRIRLYTLQQVIVFQLEPRMARDQVLRGQFEDASTQIVPLLAQIRIQKDTLENNPTVRNNFKLWKQNLYEAYGKEGQAKEELRKGGSQDAVAAATAAREQVWKSGLTELSILVEGGTANSRRLQAMYQQCLCMHEQAERLQARTNALAHANPPPDADEMKRAREATQAAWQDAAGWWNNFTQDYPKSASGIHAQLLLACAREAQGMPAVARTLLENSPAEVVGELNRVSRLYLARRLKAP